MISRDLRRRCPHATERHAQRQPIHHQRFHRKGAVSILSDCVVSSPVGVQLLSARSIVRYVGLADGDLGRRASTATLVSYTWLYRKDSSTDCWSQRSFAKLEESPTFSNCLAHRSFRHRFRSMMETSSVSPASSYTLTPPVSSLSPS